MHIYPLIHLTHTYVFLFLTRVTHHHHRRQYHSQILNRYVAHIFYTSNIIQHHMSCIMIIIISSINVTRNDHHVRHHISWYTHLRSRCYTEAKSLFDRLIGSSRNGFGVLTPIRFSISSARLKAFTLGLIWIQHHLSAINCNGLNIPSSASALSSKNSFIHLSPV